MRQSRLTGCIFAAAIAVAAALPARAQTSAPPSIDLPNPYAPATSFGQLPAGRTWGGTTAVAVDRDGKSVWVFERCGGESCADSKLAPILHFNSSGKLLASFGAGMFVFPHAIAIDNDGDVWVADADGRNGKGEQVVKFSPTGKVLLTLGKAGMPGDAPGYFNRPSGVAIARNGDIFVADGHGGDSNARVVKFSKSGKFITAWARRAPRRANSILRTPSPWIRSNGSTWRTVRTAGSRCSTRTESSSPTGGSSAGRAGFISTRTTCSTSRIHRPWTRQAAAPIPAAATAFVSAVLRTAW